ncbi:MAG TPA: LysM peptidoglycan-binding domain-containing protein [Polyangiaceae bacterium]
MPGRLSRTLMLVGALFLAPATAFAAGPDRARTHTVYAGQRLGSIAKRYNVSIDALCHANGIRERDPIRPGQKLVIPAPGDKDGSQARADRLAKEGKTERSAASSKVSTTKPGTSWSHYQRQPARKGYVEIITHTKRWRGLVLDSKGRIRPTARKSITSLLDASEPRPKIPDGLIRLMVRVSDTFGGRPLRVVSGFRTTSYFRDSRHRTSEAVDFSVVGVPNAAVRDYLVTLGKVGVGYYPNSSFLHLDVRTKYTYWVDYAGPGEAPRRTVQRPAAEPIHHDDRAEEEAEGGGSPEGTPEEGEGALPATPPLSATSPDENRTGSLPTRPASAP